MFNFLKKGDSNTAVLPTTKTDLHVIAKKYVEEVEAIEPEVSEDERIANIIYI